MKSHQIECFSPWPTNYVVLMVCHNETWHLQGVQEFWVHGPTRAQFGEILQNASSTIYVL